MILKLVSSLISLAIAHSWPESVPRYEGNGLPLSFRKRENGGNSIGIYGCICHARHNQHTQILLCKHGAQSKRDSWVTGYFQGAAAINGRSQVAQKGNTGRARLDMSPHLVASKRFQSAIQIFGEAGKQIAAFRGAFAALGCRTLAFFPDRCAVIRMSGSVA